MAEITLPEYLEGHANKRFDQLLKDGELFYKKGKTKYATDATFKFQFQITGAIKKKPIMSPSDPGRSKPKGPFEDPDPNFVITSVGPSHTLELNMYWVHRPSLILHTNTYKPQTDALDEGDIAASFAVLRAMNKAAVFSRYLLFYNCGAEAGSSQGHKHLQLVPKGNERKRFGKKRFEILLDHQSFSSQYPSVVEGVPYKAWAMTIHNSSTPDQIHEQYLLLLQKTTGALEAEGAAIAYNVVATTEWICLIPRRHPAGPDGVAPTNGPGMLGMIWVADKAEKKAWKQLGMTDHLAYLEIPRHDPPVMAVGRVFEKDGL